MQDNKPRVEEYLERVGVTNLRTIVVTTWQGKKYTFVPRIELTLDLEEKKRGAHMSRLIESITETIEEETNLSHTSLEEVEKSILERLRSKHPYERAQITMDTELVIPKKTPKTGKNTMETHDVSVKVSYDNKKYAKTLKVTVIGNTSCPHAMNQTGGKTHIQRARAALELEMDYNKEVRLEDMVALVEKSFSSEVYTLLKTEDEVYVVEKMFSNPHFVEDVTREILNSAKKEFSNCKIKVKTISEESIHRHDVIAEGYAEN
jgi:GTP cyclohydrolase IV